jgi:hypothetical protein
MVVVMVVVMVMIVVVNVNCRVIVNAVVTGKILESIGLPVRMIVAVPALSADFP